MAEIHQLGIKAASRRMSKNSWNMNPYDIQDIQIFI